MSPSRFFALICICLCSCDAMLDWPIQNNDNPETPSEDKTPVICIESVSNITTEAVTLTANLSSVGSSKVTQMGFCWSSSNETPSLSDKYSILGNTDSPCLFNATITGLTPGSIYYCRAYARNSAGVAYSPVITFTTTEYPQSTAEVSIIGIADITSNSATLTATLTSLGTSNVTQMGFCWSASNKIPTLADNVSKQGESDIPCSFSATINKLSSETTYYCRAYATNAAGTSYSDVITLTTLFSYKVMAAYSFDDSNFNDYYNHNDGVGIGEVSFIENTPGGRGKSVFINGLKGGFINIPFNPFTGLTEYSISLWIKDFSSGALIYGLSTNWGAYYDCPRILMLDSGFFEFKVNAGSSGSGKEFVYPYTSIQSSYWHHLVFSCSKKNDSSSALLNLYVDGVLIESKDSSFSNNYDNYGITKIAIGGDRSGAYSASSMKMDELIIFGEALKASKVQYLFDARGNTHFK